jgi:hypothetical protein
MLSRCPVLDQRSEVAVPALSVQYVSLILRVDRLNHLDENFPSTILMCTVHDPIPVLDGNRFL